MFVKSHFPESRNCPAAGAQGLPIEAPRTWRTVMLPIRAMDVRKIDWAREGMSLR